MREKPSIVLSEHELAVVEGIEKLCPEKGDFVIEMERRTLSPEAQKEFGLKTVWELTLVRNPRNGDPADMTFIHSRVEELLVQHELRAAAFFTSDFYNEDTGKDELASCIYYLTPDLR